jgi:hypothetical protein
MRAEQKLIPRINAPMVDKNDSLAREIDEELRREKFEKLWEQYGTYILIAAGAIVLAVGGYQFYDQRKKSIAAENGARYEEAVKLVEQSKTDDAQKALTGIISSGHAGYASLAQLQLAGIHLKANRPKDALAVFEALATSPTADTDIKTFALLQAASLRLGEADFTELQNRLKPLAEGTTPWRFQALELLGTAAFKAGKFDEARAQLTPLLADQETPRATMDRIQLILSSIAASETGKPAAAPAAPAPAAPQTPAKETTPSDAGKPAAGGQ